MARSMSLMTAVEGLENDGEETGAVSDAIEVPGEVRDSEDDVEGSEEVLDEAGDDVDTLEDIKDVLEEAADNGEGIDDTAAKLVEITTEAIYARLGFGETKIVGALEGFKNPRSRIAATRYAAEAIGDTVSRVWEAIKKFFKDLVEKIKGLWKTYMTAVGRLKRGAEALRRKAAATVGAKKEETFEDKSLAEKILGKDGKINIGTALDNTIKAIEEVGKSKDRIAEIIDDIKGGKELEGKIKMALDASGHVSASREHKAGADAGDVLLGNKAIEYYLDAGAEKVSVDMFVSSVDNGKEDAEIPVADKRELEEYCSKVIKLCNAVSASKERKEKADKRTEKALDKLSRKPKAGASDGEKADARDARIVREMLRVSSKMSYLPEKIAIAGGHTVLSYVTKCLRMHGKEA